MNGRFLRTLRHLSPVQVAHRLRLRARMAGRSAGLGGVQGGPAPALREVPLRPPVDVVRPCPGDVIRRVADEAGRGDFRHLSVLRLLPDGPFPAPSDVPLLWAFEHEYMECLFDLALAGRREGVQRLLEARVAADAHPGPAGLHPYTEARRTAVLCRLCGLFGPETPRPVRDAAFAGACRVEANLEWDVGGNHLLENGLALTLAGAAFRGRRAGGFLERGLSILRRGLAEQVNGDGGHYEGSPMYHARVLSVLTEGALAAAASGHPPPAGCFERLASMCGFLEGILAPDGGLPLLGDCVRDDRLSPRDLLAGVAGRLPVPPARTTPGDRCFPETGFYVFDDPGAGNRLILDGGPVCPPRLPAHGQADTFTFELWVAGKPAIVDSGVYEYAPGEMRDHCRSTRAHNTLEVDGESSAEVWGAFRVGRRGAVGTAWRLERGRGEFAGRHAGYRHRGVEVARSVSHLAEGVWVVADRATGRRPFCAVNRLQFVPGAEVVVVEENLVRVSGGNAILWVRAAGRGRIRLGEGWHCPRFGVRERTTVAEVHGEGRVFEGGWVLAVGEGRAPECRLSEGIVRVQIAGLAAARALP